MLHRLEELERLFPELPRLQDSRRHRPSAGVQTTLFDPTPRRADAEASTTCSRSGNSAEWAAKVERATPAITDYLCELKIDGPQLNLRC
jgi:NAD-dependent DNA ligase